MKEELNYLRSVNDAHVKKFKDQIEHLNKRLGKAKHAKVLTQHKASHYKCKIKKSVPLESKQIDDYAKKVANLGEENAWKMNWHRNKNKLQTS